MSTAADPRQSLEEVVDSFLRAIEVLPQDPPEEQFCGDLDEVTYTREQLEYAQSLPPSSGQLIYNALVFFAHGQSENQLNAAWLRQHTDTRIVLISMGMGYYGVMLSTLVAALRLLDRVTCQTHPFYHETNRQNRIPNDASFADRVRGWVPALCTNDLFVRFACTADTIMLYPVVHSDYDFMAGGKGNGQLVDYHKPATAVVGAAWSGEMRCAVWHGGGGSG
eukprot:NODE_1406_length_1549_cov_42.405333_g1267_i0.p1 GENE.NODE_1406_length_1549_cov_42.405333_g1267_i0~~NODE_1406_length_1549_cov_42.405333_g1267_i0.p1  ORF type:complete len:256 (-),score=42.67 NODE_1406_length_1549_cov_42.405333_g1267_i0:781-1446(-)